MRFCKKCGSIMFPDKEKDQLVWKCRKCGRTEKAKKEETLIVSKEKKDKKEIPVIDMDKEKKKLSVVDVKCHKCGNVGAMWWLQQTRSGDEPATRFFKCVECGFTWRENS